MHLRHAFLVAVVVCIVALVFIKLPAFPANPATATSTPATSMPVVQEESTTTAAGTPRVPAAPFPSVQIGGQTVHVTIADTPDKREQGLSGRKGLAPDEGMLFVFPGDGQYGFWMKDMLFSIDIVWVSASSTVVDIQANVSPDTYPSVFQPKAAARYVLELPAGFAKLYNVQKGGAVVLP